jgi:cysteinyl-tRNA synthetase
LKRLWEAYENLKKIQSTGNKSQDEELEARCTKLMTELDEFMNDDFNTAKVLANMFELVPVINGIKDKHLPPNALSAAALEQLQQKMKLYIEDILGLKMETAADNNTLDGVMQLLINMRKEARAKKDYATSDKIRNELLALGIQLKDEKDGNISYTIN